MKQLKTGLTIVFMLLSLCLIFVGCFKQTQPSSVDLYHAKADDDLRPVKPVGEVPAALKTVVEQDLFQSITAFSHCLLKSEVISKDDENHLVTHRIQMMDRYGNELAQYTLTTDDAYHISTLTATADGGFLFAVGFRDYAYGDGVWASDKGVASRVVKCDALGNLQFDIPFPDVKDNGFQFCFEKNNCFYFFGEIHTPEKRITGTYTSTDIFITVMDAEGNIKDTKIIAGSDFDFLYAAEMYGDDFLLSILSQSDDGDFAGSNSGGYGKHWIIVVDNELRITEKKLETGRDSLDDRIGFKDTLPVYLSDPFLNNFDSGRPTAWIEYEDYFLIVSQNRTGIYEKTPLFISATWYYTETVYSGYDKDGKLLFRTSVDSTPNYNAE